jgi:hypothetical protein
MNKQLREEAIALFDSGETRSFDEIYGKNNDLFNEGIDDIIDPKMKKLFESTYQTGNIQQKRLFENEETENYIQTFLDSWPNIISQKDEILKQVPLKTKKEIKEVLDDCDGNFCIALAKFAEELGVTSPEDMRDLSKEEFAKFFSFCLIVAAISDEFDELKDIIQTGLTLRESFFKDEDGKPSTLKQIGGGFARAGKVIAGIVAGGIGGAVIGVLKVVADIIGLPILAALSAAHVGSVGFKNADTTLGKVAKTSAGIGLGTAAGAVGGAVGIAQDLLIGIPSCIFEGLFIGGYIGTGKSELSNYGNFATKTLSKKVKESAFNRIYEEANGSPGITHTKYNFSGDEEGPSGDGVPGGHNHSGMGGADPAAVQGQGRGDSGNAALFNK